MAKDVREFYWNKSLNTIIEAESDLSLGYGLTSHLQAIKKYWESQSQKNKAMRSSMASGICPLLYDLDDVLAECKIFSQKRKAHKNFARFNPFTKFIFVQQIKGRLNTIEKGLQRIVEATEGSFSQPRIFPNYGLKFDEKDVYDNSRFHSHQMSIEKSLLEGGSNNALKVIGIVGMCGSGKTALVKQVFNNPKVSSIFTKKIWVGLSDIRSYEKDLEAKILKFILEAMGEDVDFDANNLSTAELLGKLKVSLSGGRYLIVLDDIWHVTDFFVNLNERSPDSTKRHFLCGLPRSCGGVVIITSRLEEVARRIVGEKYCNKYLITLQPLLNQDQKDDCWDIFKQNRHPTFNIDDEALEKIKKDIIYQCHGLPLAAKALATIFSEMRDNEDSFSFDFFTEQSMWL